jgi:hypothetical protein
VAKVIQILPVHAFTMCLKSINRGMNCSVFWQASIESISIQLFDFRVEIAKRLSHCVSGRQKGSTADV